METSGREALHIAARDTILDMKAMLMQRFTSDVERLVSAEMNERSLVQQLVLEIVQHIRQELDIKDDEDMEVILPRDVVGLEDLRRRPEKFEQDTLTHFVRSLTGGMLRKGVVFKASDDISAGIRVRLTDRNIEIDLTDESVAALLLEHLQPRFRALLEGIVK
jgi:V/A-type H+-transporting ATPase subunit E